MSEPKSGFYEWMSKFTRPADKITDKQVDILLDAPGVRFPDLMRQRMKFYIMKNWAKRPGRKSAFELFKEAGHPCAYEFFYKLLNGVKNAEGEIIAPGFEEILAEKMKTLSEFDSSVKAEKQAIVDITQSIEIQYEEFSKIFTEGVFHVLKDNLVFRNGKPIAVREGNDRDRMGQCHAKLTEDDFEKSSNRLGPDEEASFGLGRKLTRKHKRRGKKNKTKARKVRRGSRR